MSRYKRVTFLVAVVALLAVPTIVTASHTFDDVDDTNTFHSEISWLADADVTRGCNPPANTLFCPDANVTRGQMAAFMQRFANYLGAADGVVDEADDAATVAGYTPAQLGSLTGNPTAFVQQDLDSFTNQAIQQIGVNAPVDGYLIIDADVAYVDTDDSEILQWLQMDNIACNNVPVDTTSIDFSYGSTTSTARLTTVVNSGFVAVSAGDHTVTLCAREFSSNGDPAFYTPTIQVVFSPFGTVASGISSAPAGASSESLPGMTN